VRSARASGHFVYLALTKGGDYYCGYAANALARVRVHNAGRGSKILRGKRPVRLAYARRFSSKNEALRFEALLKRRPHAYKRSLCTAWLRRQTRKD